MLLPYASRAHSVLPADYSQDPDEILSDSSEEDDDDQDQ